MGMSIDEAISHFNTYSSTMGSGQTTQAQHEESKRVAIDTMRKYQEIEEIMKKEYRVADMSQCLVERLVEIREVLEDGRN